MTRYVDDGAKGINLPAMRQRWTGTTFIYTCPDHPDADLEPDDGVGLWCPQGEHYLPADCFDDPDGWRDRMIDDRDGTHVT